jgi:putative endonuclease
VLPKSKKKTLSKKQLLKNNFALGAGGENRARAFLQNLGYTIITMNYQVGRYEIDIIARDTSNQELVFVEVKTRKTNSLVSPATAVNAAKLGKMAQVAAHFMRATRASEDYRFDIISICGDKVEHFTNVTWP